MGIGKGIFKTKQCNIFGRAPNRISDEKRCLMSVRVGSRSGPWRHRLSAGRGRPLERLQLISHLVFTSTLTSVVEERVWKYQLEADWLDKWDVARSNQWNHLFFFFLFFVFFFPLQFHVIASYPRVWNMPQSWQCEIEVYKATYHFIYAQKNFFTGESTSTQSVADVGVHSKQQLS